MRNHLRRLTRWKPTKSGRSSVQRLLSSGSEKGSVASSSLDETPSTAGLRDKFLKAPFQRVVEKSNRPPLFPWRHSGEPLARLDPTSPEFHEKGQLLGGNLYSSHPLVDELVTAYFFMNTPWYKMLFLRDWQDDLAENMSWAYVQGVAGILSNVYRGMSYYIPTVNSRMRSSQLYVCVWPLSQTFQNMLFPLVHSSNGRVVKW
jgi:hypothetical protein